MPDQLIEFEFLCCFTELGGIREWRYIFLLLIPRNRESAFSIEDQEEELNSIDVWERTENIFTLLLLLLKIINNTKRLAF